MKKICYGFFLLLHVVVCEAYVQYQLPKKYLSATTFSQQAVSINQQCQAVAVWSENVTLGGSTGFPVIAAFFENGSWGIPQQISTTAGIDGAFVYTSNLSARAITSLGVAADINNAGNVLVAWPDKDSSGIWVSVFTYATSTWSSPILLTVPDSDFVTFEDIMVFAVLDDDNKGHVIWWQYSLETNIFSLQSSDVMTGIWGNEVILNANVVGGRAGFSVSLAKSDNKKIACSFIAPALFNTEIYSAYFDEVSWNIPLNGQSILTINDLDNLNTIAINNEGNMICGFNTFTDKARIYGAFFDAQSSIWTAQELLQYVFRPIATTISINNNDRGFLINAVPFSTFPSVLLSFDYNDGTWKDFKNVSIAASGYSEIFLLACNNDFGNGCVAFNRVKEDTSLAYYNGVLNTWSVLNKVELFGNPTVVDCQHENANAILLTDQLEVITCCGCAVPFSIPMPQNISGSCAMNIFPTQFEYFKTLVWQSSVAEDEVDYKIYRDNEFIDQVPASQHIYFDHNRPAETEELYGVSLINDQNVESAPAQIFISC